MGTISKEAILVAAGTLPQILRDPDRMNATQDAEGKCAIAAEWWGVDGTLYVEFVKAGEVHLSYSGTDGTLDAKGLSEKYLGSLGADRIKLINAFLRADWEEARHRANEYKRKFTPEC